MEKYLDELKEVLELEKNLKQMKDELKEIDGKLLTFRGKVNSNQIEKTKKYRAKQLAREEGIVETMKSKIESLSTEIETRTKKLNTELRTATGMILDEYWDEEDKDSRISQIEQEMRVREFEEEKSSKIADLEKEIKVREQKRQKQERIHDLEKQIATKTQNKDKKNQSVIPNNEKAIKEAEETIKHLEEEIKNISQMLIDNPNQSKLYTSQIKKNAENIEKNKALIETKRKQIQEEKSQIVKLESQIVILEGQLGEVQAQVIEGDELERYAYMDEGTLAETLKIAREEVSFEEHIVDFAKFNKEQLRAELKRVQNIKVIDEENVDFIEEVAALNMQLKSVSANSEKKNIISALEKILEKMQKETEKAAAEKAAAEKAAAEKAAAEKAAAEKAAAEKAAAEKAAAEKAAAEKAAAEKAAAEKAAAEKAAAEKAAAEKAAAEKAAAEKTAAEKAVEKGRARDNKTGKIIETEELPPESHMEENDEIEDGEYVEVEQEPYIFVRPWFLASEEEKQSIISEIVKSEMLDDEELDIMRDIINDKYRYIITMDELKEALAESKVVEEEEIEDFEEYGTEEATIPISNGRSISPEETDTLVEKIIREMKQASTDPKVKKVKNVEELFEEENVGGATDVKTGEKIETEELPPESKGPTPTSSVAATESKFDKMLDKITGVPAVIGIDKVGEMIASAFKKMWSGWKSFKNKLFDILTIRENAEYDEFDDYDDLEIIDLEEEEKKEKRKAKRAQIKKNIRMRSRKVADKILDVFAGPEDLEEDEYEPLVNTMGRYEVDNSENQVENGANQSYFSRRKEERQERTHTDD